MRRTVREYGYLPNRKLINKCADSEQILFHSLEKEYFLTNLPWLIGSLGTIVEDVTIFVQFRVFGGGTQQASAVVAA